jgi:hypothetical protein
MANRTVHFLIIQFFNHLNRLIILYALQAAWILACRALVFSRIKYVGYAPFWYLLGTYLFFMVHIV